MPKNRDTRAQRAEELRRRFHEGPCFSDVARDFDVDEATRQFRIWSNTWVLHELDYLVPELWRAVRQRRLAAEQEETARKLST